MENGLPCFVRTDTGNNAAVCEGFGFNVVHEAIVADTDLMNWDILREGTAGR